MARLFIANLAKQPHDFLYRVPAEVGFSRQLHMRRLLPGTQQQIHTESPLPVLEAIVDQHRQYGLIDAREVHKTQGFVGLCFSFDEPVNLDQLHYGADHNQGALYDRGMDNLRHAAFTIDRAFESTLIEAQRRGDIHGSATVKAVHVEALEDSDHPKFGQRITVDHQAEPRRA